MLDIVPSIKPEDITSTLQAAHKLQIDNFNRSEPECANMRKQHLLNLKRLLVENKDEIIAAVSKDYGNRSYYESLTLEYISVLGDINNNIKHLKKWMKVQKRHVDHTMFFGAKNRLIPQPLGVIGMIVPWNFPINLGFTGLSAAFAAGNRAMVKMSENSVHLSRKLIELSPKYFAPEKLQFFEETGLVGPEFSKIPFDHLLFTGSGETGRKVMASAAANLTPVTLELGGKCPAIIDPNYPLAKAVERIMYVKQLNAGQICTNVDYVYISKNQVADFVTSATNWVNAHVPDINSKDYTSIIDQRSYERIEATVADAKDKGARVIQLGSHTPNAKERKYPLTLILDANEEMNIWSRETFGPLLLVKTYESADEVISQVSTQDRPLALYPFSNDTKLQNKYISRIMSGGVTVNDALLHVGQHDLPFGGVGASGMGHYHGYEGFQTFSKLRPIMYQASFSSLKFLAPPYGKFADKVLHFLFKKNAK